MGKTTICICENKDADQLRGNREADQRLCFRYMDSTIPLLLKIRNFKLLALFLCLYRPVCVRPVRKPHCLFSHEVAQFIVIETLDLPVATIVCTLPQATSFTFSCFNAEIQMIHKLGKLWLTVKEDKLLPRCLNGICVVLNL